MDRSTLRPTEPHPAAISARDWLHKNISGVELMKWQEAFASTAIEGNRLGEICNGTIQRLLSGEPVSDRYMLGLVWTLQQGMADEKTNELLEVLRAVKEKPKSGEAHRLVLQVLAKYDR